jgi:hypothetical protein
MAALIAFMFLAISVKQEAPLRSSCDAEAQVIAKLAAGSEVTIGFVLSGEGSACYKITATVHGKELRGYVAASALEGLDSFEQDLRSAPSLDFGEVMTAVHPAAARASTNPASSKQAAAVETAVRLLSAGQPLKALELLEPQARATKDPGLLSIAGAAAWRADDSGKALEYWRAALDLQPDPALESLYKRVEQENSNDKSSARLFGIRIAFRYEADAIGADTAREMVKALDQEFGRISGELGCSAEERIVAIAQSPEAYRKTTNAAEWSGGQYDGRIRVPVARNEAMDATLHRTLAHEITHACLSLTGKWPAWLQEGLAQKMSGDVMSPQLRDKLTEWAKDGKLTKLGNLGQDWSRMDTAHAVAAYGLSLQAVDLFYDTYGIDGVRNLLRNPDRLPAIAADLDQRLGL